MALESLLYVSESKIEQSDADSQLNRILAKSHASNPTVGITGALVFTGTHFAQVIEGEKTAIDQLFGSIVRDPRHDKVTIVSRDSLAERRFPDWSMAFNGPSPFALRLVTPLLVAPSDVQRSRVADWLTELLEEFSRVRAQAA